MSFLGSKVIFLEPSDFNGKHLTYQNQPVKGLWVVMVQKTDCGYCTESKPDFQKIADQFSSRILGKGIVLATIQLDGPEREAFRTIFTNLGVQLTGVPTYIVFNNGEYIRSQAGGMNADALVKTFGIH